MKNKKKKIYIITQNSKGGIYGIGTYIRLLINVLKDLNFTFALVRINAQGNKIEILEQEGYEQINIPGSGSLSKKDNIQYYQRNVAYLLKDIISKNKEEDIIFHLNFITSENLVRYLKKMFRCRIILVTHYTDWGSMIKGDYTFLKRILQKSYNELPDSIEKDIVKCFKKNTELINKVDCLVCIAKHTFEIFKQFGGLKLQKIEIINNALKDIYAPLSDTRKAALREKYYIERNTVLILCVGRLDNMKGFIYMILSFKKILAIHPNCRLIIVGDGNFNNLLKFSDGCWNKITFTGYLDMVELYKFYQLADIGVVCSLYEEFGYVAIEMMMHSLPVVVTNTGGLAEIVEDNVSGLKVPIETVNGNRQVNVKYLTKKITYLIENPDMAKKLGVNGRKRFLEKYEMKLFKEKMLALYHEL